MEGKYETMNEAALAWAMQEMRNSVADDRELGTLIYED